MKTPALILLFTCQISLAALPPEYQNQKDLNVMVKYIEANEEILSTLQSIDFKAFKVYYNQGCVANFGRKHTPKTEGWVGPADPLEFKSSSCQSELE